MFSTVVWFSPVKNIHFTSLFHRSPVQSVKSVHFTTVLSVRHARSDERVAGRRKTFAFYYILRVRHARRDERVGRRNAFYHSFDRPTRTKWPKGRSATYRKLHFTTVLSVRHARSDETVARRRKKVAFYHSFERPKGSRTQVKNLRFTTVLSVWHARSHERVVKSTGAIPAPRQKKNIF